MRIAAALEGMTSASLGDGTPYASCWSKSSAICSLVAAVVTTEQVKRVMSMISESDLTATGSNFRMSVAREKRGQHSMCCCGGGLFGPNSWRLLKV